MQNKLSKAVVWGLPREVRRFPILRGHKKVEVAILGGGMAGVWVAFELAKNGIDVILIEKGKIGSGATGDTTAIITENIDTPASDLIKNFGKNITQKIYQSHELAISRIEETVSKEKIDCDFTRISNFLISKNENETNLLRDEFEIFKKLNINCRLKISGLQGIKNTAYIEFLNQAKFHPGKFLEGLARSARAHGAKIFEDSEGARILFNEKDNSWQLDTPKGKISSKFLVVSTYSPVHPPLGLFFKKGMYLTYMLDLKMTSEINEGVYEDLDNPYHYFRVDKINKQTRILLGGEDHRQDIPIDKKKNFSALREYAEKIFGFGNFQVINEWDGQILESVDGLPFIGAPKGEKSIFFETAFSGNGMTYSVIAAGIIRDLIAGKKNQFEEIYRASRRPKMRALISKGSDYLEELFGGAISNTFRLNNKKNDKI